MPHEENQKLYLCLQLVRQATWVHNTVNANEWVNKKSNRRARKQESNKKSVDTSSSFSIEQYLLVSRLGSLSPILFVVLSTMACRLSLVYQQFWDLSLRFYDFSNSLNNINRTLRVSTATTFLITDFIWFFKEGLFSRKNYSSSSPFTCCWKENFTRILFSGSRWSIRYCRDSTYWTASSRICQEF